MKLPYSDSELEAARAEIASLEEKLKAAHQNLQKMAQANHAAERDEEVRKAKKLTLAGSEILEMLLDEDACLVHSSSWRSNRYFVSTPGNSSNYFRPSVVDRLILAKYVVTSKSDQWRTPVYVISDDGRKALKAFKHE